MLLSSMIVAGNLLWFIMTNVSNYVVVYGLRQSDYLERRLRSL